MTVIITKTSYLSKILANAEAAAKVLSTFDQQQIDKIVNHTGLQCSEARIPLAQMAVMETKRGVMEDKVIKNHFACETVVNGFRDVKTCGIIESDIGFGFSRIAEPVGIILALLPVTNPTSTALYKILMALKTRNTIIIAPHPSASKCTLEAVSIASKAAIHAGAPEHTIQCLQGVTRDEIQQFMKNPSIGLIWATGGAQMVSFSMTSGRPCITGGAGNCPVVVDTCANYPEAAAQLIMSKSFDNGLICASENSVIVIDDQKNNQYQRFSNELINRGGFILDKDDTERLRNVLMGKDGLINSEIVGKSTFEIAKIAGLKASIPPETLVLIAEVEKVGALEPWSHEKLSPLLALYKVCSFDEAIIKAEELLNYGGLGHTSVLYTNNKSHIDTFSMKMPTSRVLVNCPSSQGVIGDIYNFRLKPTLSIGCGHWGGGSLNTEITPYSLMSIKTVVERRNHFLWLKQPAHLYYGNNCLTPAIREEIQLGGFKRIFIVSDRGCSDAHILSKVTQVISAIAGLDIEVFCEIQPDPSFADVKRGAKAMARFNPDVIVALGGGSPMDAAKIMRLINEDESLIDDFDSISARFLDIHKRIFKLHPGKFRPKLICIPTTSGTGSEVSPFAVISHLGKKYPLASYSFTPEAAIVDGDFVKTQPKSLAINAGLDALSHALEGLVSVMSSDFTKPLAISAARTILAPVGKGGLRDSVLMTSPDEQHLRETAQIAVHYAATKAGQVLANSFLGVDHAMAHALGGRFHLPHGLCCILLLPYVIRHNSSTHPTKITPFPNLLYPIADRQYSEIFGSVDQLIDEIQSLRSDLDSPLSIQQAGVDKEEFMAELDQLSLTAFDDQCMGTNPRSSMVAEIKDLYIKAYFGEKP